MQRKPDDAPSPQQPQGGYVDRLIKLLAARSPATSGRDDAYMLLSSLSIPELLAVMEGVADCGYLPQLHVRVISWTNPFTLGRLLSALYAVEHVRVPPTSIATGQLKVAGMALDLLPHDQQIQIVEYVLHHRGDGVNVTEVFEGALAMREGKDAARDPQARGGDAVAAGPGVAPAPVESGPWAPPGEQPIPFYMLNTLKRMLGAQGMKIDKGALSEDELGLMPDITTAPVRDQAARRGVSGRSQGGDVRQPVRQGGVTVALGPTTEPDVEGGIPAPARGVHVLVTATGRHRVPVPQEQARAGPVGEPEPAGERRWKFELRPMIPEQKAAVATVTVGGMLLLIAMLLLAPVGA